jgi:transposase
MEGELQDDQWALIAPLLPQPKLRGRPRADDRRTINGILWVLRSGARWRDLPREFGTPSTCHRRLQEWQDQGVWKHLWLTFLGALDQQGKLDWSQAFLDGSFVPAKRGRGHRLWLEGQREHGPSADRGQWLAFGLSGDGSQCI